MSNKLQQGDYVTDLTEEQFDELMDLQPKPFLKYKFDDVDNPTLFYSKSLRSFIDLHIENVDKCVLKTKLTFYEFRERAINTFSNE